MAQSWKGPVVVGLIGIGVVFILASNVQLGGNRTSSKPVASSPGTPEPKPAAQVTAVGKGIPEHPIGDEVTQNQIQVAAVWLDAVTMEGMATPGGEGLIHLEADIRATEANPNGFAKDEFVPYLKVNYSLVPAAGGSAIASGELLPMVAWDGLHYGATLAMPKPGNYKLVYDIQPPSVNGLGRHSDAATGVAPWWKPFQATFDWAVEPPTTTTSR